MINIEDTFMNLCIQGKIDPKDIDEYVEYWHTSDSKQELHEFLGMTFEEYGKFMMKDCVNELLESRRLKAAYDIQDIKCFKTEMQNMLSKLMKKNIKIIAIDFSTSNKVTFEFSDNNTNKV